MEAPVSIQVAYHQPASVPVPVAVLVESDVEVDRRVSGRLSLHGINSWEFGQNCAAFSAGGSSSILVLSISKVFVSCRFGIASHLKKCLLLLFFIESFSILIVFGLLSEGF